LTLGPEISKQAAVTSILCVSTFGAHRKDSHCLSEIDNEHKKVTFKVIPTRVIVREESPSDSALIREPLADRNQFLQQHILQPTLRSVIPDCYGVNVNADQVRHLAKPDTP